MSEMIGSWAHQRAGPTIATRKTSDESLAIVVAVDTAAVSRVVGAGYRRYQDQGWVIARPSVRPEMGAHWQRSGPMIRAALAADNPKGGSG